MGGGGGGHLGEECVCECTATALLGEMRKDGDLMGVYRYVEKMIERLVGWLSTFLFVCLFGWAVNCTRSSCTVGLTATLIRCWVS